ncbi:MAG: ribosome maturation factor RimM [Spirochaetes bacterium]|nr:ribosome maturation factor RimM [Spirochaetota bacterium]
MTEKFVIALAGPPFGLKGFIKVRSLSGETDHLLKLDSVVVSQGEKERRLVIEEKMLSGAFVLMRFAGINSPEEAKALNGAKLLAGRDEAAPLRDGEFYIEDLKGLDVVAVGEGAEGGEGETLGQITDVLEGGGGELVEVRLLSGDLKLVPFRDEFFGEISPQKGRAYLKKRWILE